jgi:hypothetical protein
VGPPDQFTVYKKGQLGTFVQIQVIIQLLSGLSRSGNFTAFGRQYPRQSIFGCSTGRCWLTVRVPGVLGRYRPLTAKATMLAAAVVVAVG